MSQIFAINAGSSSLKFQLLAMPEERVIAKGNFERIGEEDTLFSLTVEGQTVKESLPGITHKQAVSYLLDILHQKEVLGSLENIAGVGHRVAHGGVHFKQSALVTPEVLRIIEELSLLAPSHNPINLQVIKAFQEFLPSVPNVAVFDTAFHQTLAPEHYLYPLPKRYYEQYGIRKYGFHGTSHKYIAYKAEEVLAQENLRIISCHLGNGASICAIRNKESVNTSMGFTPLAGVMMGSRSGDIDPAIIPFLMEQEGMSSKAIIDMLNKESGLLAVSELSNDLREIQFAYARRSSKAALAINMFVNRIAYTIAQYHLDLGGVDAIVFTAGIGENSAIIRQKITEKLVALGVHLNKEANETSQICIHALNSSIKLLVLPTNEELMIALETLELIS
ncbi:acetate kinase [Streptococcus rupicaprae]|uniref:Acetate kinase n=1 Tax=Streptococcus rupicaprae TaxID=759619 RepID=A0ABV2FF59_9STRE